ncbi:MAG: hypothetical protein Q7S02_05465 [bacterium]|nr:hypothetical protein [bacterium]
MPIIRVINWPSRVRPIAEDRRINPDDFFDALERDGAFTKALGEKLRRACIDAHVPGVESQDLVTVSFDSGYGVGDPTLVIVVEGLFDRPDRTKEVRDRLAWMLGEAAKPYIHGHWTVETLVQRFDPTVDAYWKG